MHPYLFSAIKVYNISTSMLATDETLVIEKLEKSRDHEASSRFALGFMNLWAPKFTM